MGCVVYKMFNKQLSYGKTRNPVLVDFIDSIVDCILISYRFHCLNQSQFI